MLSAIKRFFDEEIDAAPGDDDNGLRLATCALLLEVALADDEFAAEEREAVAAAIRSHFPMDRDQVDALVELARREREDSNDLYQFTRLVKDRFPRDRKLAVVESLWKVVWSDGVLESHEDAMMHKMGTLLGVTHRELMALKIRARDA